MSRKLQRLGLVSDKIWNISVLETWVSGLGSEGLVHIPASTGPGFRLWFVEALLVRVEHSLSLVQAHNSPHVGHIE